VQGEGGHISRTLEREPAEWVRARDAGDKRGAAGRKIKRLEFIRESEGRERRRRISNYHEPSNR
jgi:hypothetical protein